MSAPPESTPPGRFAEGSVVVGVSGCGSAASSSSSVVSAFDASVSASCASVTWCWASSEAWSAAWHAAGSVVVGVVVGVVVVVSSPEVVSPSAAQTCVALSSAALLSWGGV